MSTDPNDYSKQSRADRAIERQSKRPGGWGGFFEPAILTWRLFWDERVSLTSKLIPLGAILYLISPIDFIPELAVGPLGAIDDAGLLIIALNVFIATCPADVVAEHRQQLGYGSGSAEEDIVDGSAEVHDDTP